MNYLCVLRSSLLFAVSSIKVSVSAFFFLFFLLLLPSNKGVDKKKKVKTGSDPKDERTFYQRDFKGWLWYTNI